MPTPPPIAALPPPEFDIDRIDIDGHAGRKPVDQRQQGLAMRFTSSPITQHVKSRVRKTSVSPGRQAGFRSGSVESNRPSRKVSKQSILHWQVI